MLFILITWFEFEKEILFLNLFHINLNNSDKLIRNKIKWWFIYFHSDKIKTMICE